MAGAERQGGRSGAELLDELYAAYNAHDAARAAALYTADATHFEAAQGAERQGREGIERGLRGFLEAFPDAHWDVASRCVEGDCAAAGYTLVATLQARLGPFEPRGQRLELRGAHLFRIAGGSLSRSEDYWDAATFQRQMREGG